MEERTKWSREDLVEAFGGYLRRSCGLSSGGIWTYSYYTRRFLRARYENGVVDLSHLDAVDVIAYFTEQVSRYKSATIRGIAAALRSFLRFLHVKGLADARLVAAERIPVSFSREALRKEVISSKSILEQSPDYNTVTAMREELQRHIHSITVSPRGRTVVKTNKFGLFEGQPYAYSDGRGDWVRTSAPSTSDTSGLRLDRRGSHC